MTENIQLSQLSRPVIPGLLRSPDTIAAGIVANLAAQGVEVTASPSNPLYRVIIEFAHETSNLRQQIQDAAEDLSLAYARGDALDNIGVTYYNVVRNADETDEQYRERIVGTPDRFAIALSTQWYAQNARSIAGVKDARAITPSAGVVNVYITAHERVEHNAAGALVTINAGGVPDAALLAEISTLLKSDNVRQQTDDVNIIAGTPVDYNVGVRLSILAEPDSELVLAAARTAFAVVAEQRSALGKEINTAIIAGAVFVAGVDDAEINLFRHESNGSQTLTNSLGGSDNQFLRLSQTLIVAA